MEGPLGLCFLGPSGCFGSRPHLRTTGQNDKGLFLILLPGTLGAVRGSVLPHCTLPACGAAPVGTTERAMENPELAL